MTIQPFQRLSPFDHTVDIFLYEQSSLILGLHHILNSCLSEEEFLRAARYRLKEQRNGFVFGRYCLRMVLSEYLQCSPNELRFAAHERCKPYLLNAPHIHFNLSHSDRYLAIAISKQHPVGIDMEYLGKELTIDELPIAVLSAAEQRFCQNAVDTRTAFFSIWTAKEAWVKSLGVGIDDGFGQFSVLPKPNASEFEYDGAHPNYPNTYARFHGFADSERQLIGCCALLISEQN